MCRWVKRTAARRAAPLKIFASKSPGGDDGRDEWARKHLTRELCGYNCFAWWNGLEYNHLSIIKGEKPTGNRPQNLAAFPVLYLFYACSSQLASA
jgi:hypothetical protein